MMKARFLLLSMALVCLAVGCNRKDQFETIVLKRDGVSVGADIVFPRSASIMNSLVLDHRASDGALLLEAEVPSSVVSYSLYPGDLSVIPSSDVSASMVVGKPSGTTGIAFHLEFPRSIEWELPEEILDIQAIRLINGSLVCSLALGADFPYTEARLEQATVTLPAWVRQTSPTYLDGKQIDLTEWVSSSGLLYPEAGVQFWDHFEGIYTLEGGEGIQEPGHRLVLDATISIDGVLSVDEKNRKTPQDGATPWSLSFTNDDFDLNCYFTGFTGCVDISREMEDRTLTYSTFPPFIQEIGTVFDMDDVHAELTASSNYPIPVAVSGAIQGDKMEYPFSSSTFTVEELEYPFHILLSEKGNRVKEGMNPRDYLDIPISGLSGLIDGDPVSFGVKDLRMATNPEVPGEYRFGEGHFSIMPRLKTPLRIGKDFQIRHFEDLKLRFTNHVVKISGTSTVENTFPLDFEIRPVIYTVDGVIPNSTDPIRVAAGSRESPNVQTVTFDWPVNAHVTDLFLEFTGRTGTGRQGEDLYKDQHIAVKDITFEVLRDTKD